MTTKTKILKLVEGQETKSQNLQRGDIFNFKYGTYHNMVLKGNKYVVLNGKSRGFTYELYDDREVIFIERCPA